MFDNIPSGGAAETRAAKAKAMANCDRAIDFVRSRLNDRVGRMAISAQSQQFLRAITDGTKLSGFMPASNFSLRRRSTEALVHSLLKYSKANRQDANFKLWMGTFAWDDGVTTLAHPQMDLDRLHRKIQKAVYRCGAKLNCVYVVEADILMKLPDGSGPFLIFHVHMACWTRNSPLRPKLLANSMMKGKSFSNRFNAKSIKFTKPETPGKDATAGLAYYITKYPACVKELRPDPKRPGRNRMMKDQAKFSSKLMFRMIEVLSHLHIYDLVGGIRDGKHVRSAWKKRLERTCDVGSRSARPLSQDDIRRGWKRIAAELGAHTSKRCEIRSAQDRR